jgi:hypothetical protein
MGEGWVRVKMNYFPSLQSPPGRKEGAKMKRGKYGKNWEKI